MNIHEVMEEYRNLQDQLMDMGVDDQTRRDTIEATGVKDAFEVKCVNYAAVIKNMEANEKAIREVVKTYTARADSLKKSIEMLKTTVFQAMKETETAKIDIDPRFKISIQKNGGKLPLVLDATIEQIPEDYIIRKPEVYNEKIRAALDRGEQLEFAHYGERGESLRIR